MNDERTVTELDATWAMRAPLKIGKPGGVDLAPKLRPTVGQFVVLFGGGGLLLAFYTYVGRRVPPLSWVPGVVVVVGIVLGAFAAGVAVRTVQVDGRAGLRHLRSAAGGRLGRGVGDVWVEAGRPLPRARPPRPRIYEVAVRPLGRGRG